MQRRLGTLLRQFLSLTTCLGAAVALMSGCAHGAAANTDASSTTIFVVRHAQKADPDDNTPGARLSEDGRESARRLAASLRSTGIAAVFATPTVRARGTAQPTGTLFGVPVTEYDPASLAKLSDRIHSEWKGKSCLVVGHSNTVPAIVRALGGAVGENLASDAYDNLFVVSIAEIGGIRQVTTTRLHLPQ